jgi:hypothetical protein
MRKSRRLSMIGAVGLSLLCVASCVWVHSASETAPSRTAATCADRSLAIGYDPSVDFQETGDRGDAFTVTNHGAVTCTLDGYPSITLTDSAGRTIPFNYVDGHSQYLTRRPPKPVTIDAGGSAYLGVAKYRCDIAQQTVATRIYVLIPGQRAALSVPLVGRAQNLDYCIGAHGTRSTISISPIEASGAQTQF